MNKGNDCGYFFTHENHAFGDSGKIIKPTYSGGLLVTCRAWSSYGCDGYVSFRINVNGNERIVCILFNSKMSGANRASI
jgi:hypothetical protein